MSLNDLDVRGCKVDIFFGHTRVANEILSAHPDDDHTFIFANTHISTQNLRIVGTFGGNDEFVINYDLEPITGRLTIGAALPVYSQVKVSSAHYVNLTDTLQILTKDYKVLFPRPVGEPDIFGQPVFQNLNNYPDKVTLKTPLTNEAQRNLLTEAMFRSFYFTLIDNNTGFATGQRCFEGEIWSDEQGSVKKGAPILLPIELFPNQFGLFTAARTAEIQHFVNPGGGVTNAQSGSHGLSGTDVWTFITGTSNYDGLWKVTIVDANIFTINTVFAGDETTGSHSTGDTIAWGFWEN